MIIILLFEYFYQLNRVPFYIGQNHERLISKAAASLNSEVLFVIGDSRAEAAIIPEIIDNSTKYDSYNIGQSGIYRGYYKLIKANKLGVKKMIIAVSPYSVFNDFDLKHTQKRSKFSSIRKIIRPNKYVETQLNGLVNRNSHLHYGLSGFLDVLNFGNVSEYYSLKGWSGYDRLGSDQYYTYLLNLESYKGKIIEEYRDKDKIERGKFNFESLLIDLKANGISVLFIRIPTSMEIKNIENDKYPWFSSYIKGRAESYGFSYLDFIYFDYSTNESDGSHLNRESALEFTEIIVKSIE